MIGAGVSERYEKDRTVKTVRMHCICKMASCRRNHALGLGFAFSPRFWRRRDVGRCVTMEEVSFCLVYHFLVIIELRSYCGGGLGGNVVLQIVPR